VTHSEIPDENIETSPLKAR